MTHCVWTHRRDSGIDTKMAKSFPTDSVYVICKKKKIKCITSKSLTVLKQTFVVGIHEMYSLFVIRA